MAAVFMPLAHLAGHGPAAEEGASALPTFAPAAIAYLVIAALLSVRALTARARLDRALAGARPARLERSVAWPVYEHSELGPMVVGLFSPRIVLPSRLLAAGEEQALACVLGHEIAHLERRDAWLAAAMHALSIVAWPVAPLWIAAARVRQLIEQACDEAALDGADANDRRQYGHTLLDMAEWHSMAVAPISGGELHFGSTLRARIEALASARHWPVATQALAVTVVPLLLLVSCTGAAPTTSTGTTAQASTATPDKDYGYEFEADPAKSAGAGPFHGPQTSPDGRMAPEAIQSVVRAHFAAFQGCYEAGLARNPKLAGTVAVAYRFGDDGVTREASIDKATTLPDPQVVSCVVSGFEKLTYPTGAGGDVTVVYPIIFNP